MVQAQQRERKFFNFFAFFLEKEWYSRAISLIKNTSFKVKIEGLAEKCAIPEKRYNRERYKEVLLWFLVR